MLSHFKQRFFSVDIFFIFLFLLDLTIRVLAATSHNQYDLGDLLAPFSLVDQAYHHEIPETSRQLWFLPVVISWLMKIIGTPNNIIEMLHVSSAVTAITSSLVLIPIYLVARRLLSPEAGVWITLLLMTNTWFFIMSSFFNPTQTYTLFFTIAITMMLFFSLSSKSTTYLLLLSTVVCLASFIRHEGMLLVVTFLIFIFWQWRKNNFTKNQVIYSLLLVSVLVSLNWILKTMFTSAHPFVFLLSSGANDTPFNFLNYSLKNIVTLTLTVLNLKLEQVMGIIINITFVGIFFFPIGYYILSNKNKVVDLQWILIYWLLYEIVTFGMLLTVSMGNTLLPKSSFNTDPTPRYYQVVSPFFIFFMYAGIYLWIKEISTYTIRFLVVVGTHALLIVFMGYQLILTLNYYAVIQSNSRNQYPLIVIAQFFRDNNIRHKNILDYSKLYYHYPFLTVLSGQNIANCSERWPVEPNYTCADKYPFINGDYYKLLALNKEIFDYLIIKEHHRPSRDILSKYSLVYQNFGYNIYKRNE